jgi:hypothetical protein
MSRSSRSWPLKPNRDAGQSTGRAFTAVVVRDRAGKQYTRWLPRTRMIDDHAGLVSRAQSDGRSLFLLIHGYDSTLRDLLRRNHIGPSGVASPRPNNLF